ncbi:hypothetical protein PsYK624_014540 [Phanerochaete sordida]|uniref:Uncharacterized protein n=1 Tax=Phanerochaete sordida TaxID=48140 RepID=A0A9P3L7V0_9APHY|nr:hypothetical protein PsYK624_014540 [Phanerochaete sordida]
MFLYRRGLATINTCHRSTPSVSLVEGATRNVTSARFGNSVSLCGRAPPAPSGSGSQKRVCEAPRGSLHGSLNSSCVSY